LRELDHSLAVERDHHLFGVVLERLADHEHRFAVAVALGIRKGDVRRDRHVARQLLPQEPELIARIPDVVAGGIDRVGLVGGVVARAAGGERGADVRLAVEDADRFVDGDGVAMEIARRRALFVGCGARDCPVGNGGFDRSRRGFGRLCAGNAGQAEKERRDARWKPVGLVCHATIVLSRSRRDKL
jgi:hypothetical protein